jgi:hypothetical protein
MCYHSSVIPASKPQAYTRLIVNGVPSGPLRRVVWKANPGATSERKHIGLTLTEGCEEISVRTLGRMLSLEPKEIVAALSAMGFAAEEQGRVPLNKAGEFLKSRGFTIECSA